MAQANQRILFDIIIVDIEKVALPLPDPAKRPQWSQSQSPTPDKVIHRNTHQSESVGPPCAVISEAQLQIFWPKWRDAYLNSAPGDQRMWDP